MTYNVRDFVTSIKSFEFLYILYLFSAFYKFAVEPLLPADLTLMFILLLLLIFIWKTIHRKISFNIIQYSSLLFLVIFLLYYTFTILWSSSSENSFRSITYIWTSSLLTFVFAMYVSSDKDRLIRFFFSAIIFAVGIALASIYILETSPIIKALFEAGFPFDFNNDGVGSYQRLSYIMSLSILGVFCLNVFSDITPGLRIILLFLTIPCFYIMGLSGGRTGALALGVAVIFGLVVCLRLASKSPDAAAHKPRKWWLVFSVVVIVILGFSGRTLISGDDQYRLAERFTNALSDNSEVLEYHTRSSRFKLALDVWAGSPLIGVGVGSYPIAIGRGDRQFLVHNFVLEILAETGILGVGLFAVVFWPGFVAMLRTQLVQENSWMFMAAHVFIWGLIIGLVSGNFAVERENWMAFAFLSAFGSRIYITQVEEDQS